MAPILLYENSSALLIFEQMNTQWNVGFNGRTGLKYEILPIICDMYGIELTGNLFGKIQCLERQVLEHDLEEAKKSEVKNSGKQK